MSNDTEILDAEVLPETALTTRPIPIVITGHGPVRSPRRMLRVNGFAIAALLLAAGIPFFWWTFVPAPLAVIFGHVALRQIRRTRQGGRRLALAALWIGYALLATVLIGFAILLLGSTVSFLGGPTGFGIERV